MMEISPFATPPRDLPMQEVPRTPQSRDWAPHASYTPAGATTPTPSTTRTTTDMPLLPTNNPVPPIPHHHEKSSQKPKWRRIMSGANEFMLGKEKASVYWYASLLSVIAALIVTFSSIFGWPPLPIWEYLRHVTR